MSRPQYFSRDRKKVNWQELLDDPFLSRYKVPNNKNQSKSSNLNVGRDVHESVKETMYMLGQQFCDNKAGRRQIPQDCNSRDKQRAVETALKFLERKNKILSKHTLENIAQNNSNSKIGTTKSPETQNTSTQTIYNGRVIRVAEAETQYSPKSNLIHYAPQKGKNNNSVACKSSKSNSEGVEVEIGGNEQFETSGKTSNDDFEEKGKMVETVVLPKSNKKHFNDKPVQKPNLKKANNDKNNKNITNGRRFMKRTDSAVLRSKFSSSDDSETSNVSGCNLKKTLKFSKDVCDSEYTDDLSLNSQFFNNLAKGLKDSDQYWHQVDIARSDDMDFLCCDAERMRNNLRGDLSLEPLERELVSELPCWTTDKSIKYLGLEDNDFDLIGEMLAHMDKMEDLRYDASKEPVVKAEMFTINDELDAIDDLMNAIGKESLFHEDNCEALETDEGFEKLLKKNMRNMNKNYNSKIDKDLVTGKTYDNFDKYMVKLNKTYGF